MNRLKFYESAIKSKSGVLYVKGKPGTGKTAIFGKMAEDNSWSLYDIRLSQIDEADLQFPFLEECNSQKVTNYAPPKWAIEANKRPCLIVFDELNRSKLAVRNAALQILNERRIGDLKFNDGVHMVALGNLGEEDGTEVEEFENALKNRLITVKHDLLFADWVKDFAEKNVHKDILTFLKSNGEYFYRLPEKENEDSYPTPRSWTFLSDMIKNTYSSAAKIEEYMELIASFGHCYVGATATSKFVRYLQDMQSLSINDIINRFDAIKDDVKKLSRDRKSELLNNLKAIKIKQYANEENKEKLANIAEFINIIDEDERVAFLNSYLDQLEAKDIEKNLVLRDVFLKRFKKIFAKLTALGA
jgi:hypothetical protein